MKNIKRAILAWVPIHLLFNAGVLLWSYHPLLALNEAISLSLPVIFWANGGFSGKLSGTNKEPFFFKGAFLIYLISYCCSTLLSQYNSLSTLLFSFKFFVNTFLLVWMFQKCLNNKSDLSFFLKVTVGVTFLIVGLALSEVILKKNIWTDYLWLTSQIPYEEMYGRTFCLPSFMADEQQMRYGFIRCYSFFSIHLGFGSACVILLSIFGILWRKGYKLTKKHNSIILATTITLLIVGTFLSNSKGPLLCMLVMMFIVFTPKQIFNYKVLIALVVGFVILFIYFPGYIDNFISLTDKEIAEEGGGSSVQLRMQQMKVAMRLFEANPLLGSGPQSLRILRHTSAGNGILGAESIWLAVLPERGILGIIAYIYWYMITFKKLKRTIPAMELIIIMGGLLLIETTNGMRDTFLYSSVLLAIRRYYQIRKSLSYKNGC